MWVRVWIFSIDLFLRRQNSAFDLFAMNTCKQRVYRYISHIIDTQRDSEKSIVKMRLCLRADRQSAPPAVWFVCLEQENL